MKNSKTQGSTFVILIIILLVAILGVLGYVVWNNFSQSDSATSNQTPGSIKTESKPAVNLDQKYTLPGEKLTFSYPKSWTATTNYKVNEYGNDNTLELTNKVGTKILIQIPSYGPPWQFGERPFGCSFDPNYVEGSSFTEPSLCPSFDELLSQPAKELNGVSVYVFSRTYPDGSSAVGGIDFVLAKDGCKGTDASLCNRPSTNTGFYLIAGATVNNASPDDYVKSEEAKEIVAILVSAHY